MPETYDLVVAPDGTQYEVPSSYSDARVDEIISNDQRIRKLRSAPAEDRPRLLKADAAQQSAATFAQANQLPKEEGIDRWGAFEAYTSALGQGAANMVPSAIEAASKIRDYLNRKAPGLGRMVVPWASDDMLRGAASATRDFVDQTYPVDPSRASSLPYSLTQGVGQVSSAIATGVATGGAGLGPQAARLASLGANAGAEFMDAWNAYKAEHPDASDDEATERAAAYAGIATGIEAKFGLGRMMSALGYGGRKAVSTVAPSAGRYLAGAATEAAAGAAEEGSQRMVQEAIVKGVDPRKWDWSGIGTEALVGSILQAPFGLAGTQADHLEALRKLPTPQPNATPQVRQPEGVPAQPQAGTQVGAPAQASPGDSVRPAATVQEPIESDPLRFAPWETQGGTTLDTVMPEREDGTVQAPNWAAYLPRSSTEAGLESAQPAGVTPIDQMLAANQWQRTLRGQRETTNARVLRAQLDAENRRAAVQGAASQLAALEQRMAEQFPRGGPVPVEPEAPETLPIEQVRKLKQQSDSEQARERIRKLVKREQSRVRSEEQADELISEAEENGWSIPFIIQRFSEAFPRLPDPLRAKLRATIAKETGYWSGEIEEGTLKSLVPGAEIAHPSKLTARQDVAKAFGDDIATRAWEAQRDKVMASFDDREAVSWADQSIQVPDLGDATGYTRGMLGIMLSVIKEDQRTTAKSAPTPQDGTWAEAKAAKPGDRVRITDRVNGKTYEYTVATRRPRSSLYEMTDGAVISAKEAGKFEVWKPLKKQTINQRTANASQVQAQEGQVSETPARLPEAAPVPPTTPAPPKGKRRSIPLKPRETPVAPPVSATGAFGPVEQFLVEARKPGSKFMGAVFKAASKMGYGSQASDIEDVASLVVSRMLASKASFDPTKGTIEKWANDIVNKVTASEVREMMAAKRGGGATPESLTADVEEGQRPLSETVADVEAVDPDREAHKQQVLGAFGAALSDLAPEEQALLQRWLAAKSGDGEETLDQMRKSLGLTDRKFRDAISTIQLKVQQAMARRNVTRQDVAEMGALDPKDAEYMGLAQRYQAGDRSVLPQLQAMVDEAAKRAGYTSGSLFHGTNRQDPILVVDPSAKNAPNKKREAGPKGFWTTPTKDYARGYGGTVYQVVAKLGRVFGGGEYMTESGSIPVSGEDHTLTRDQFVDYVTRFGRYPNSQRGFPLANGRYVYGKLTKMDPGEVYDNWGGREKPKLSDLFSYTDQGLVSLSHIGNARERGLLRDILVENGFDSYYTNGWGRGEFALLHGGNQVKSDDPVTFDAAGNIIPLSQRFNPQSDSILYAGLNVPSTTANPALEAALRQQAEPLASRLGASVTFNSQSSNPAAVRVNELGQVTLELNPSRLANLTGEEQQVILNQENLHLAEVSVLLEEWQNAGRTGSFAEHLNQFNREVWRSLPKEVQANVKSAYPVNDEAVLGGEYLRMAAEWLSNGQSTEEFFQKPLALSEKVIQFFKKLAAKLRSLTLGSNEPWAQQTRAFADRMIARLEQAKKDLAAGVKPAPVPSPVQVYQNAVIVPPIGGTWSAMVAHHGTPHKVDKFSTSKIGTGEGAQAYGWGLYFAQNQKVAEEYRKNLTQSNWKPSWRQMGFTDNNALMEQIPIDVREAYTDADDASSALDALARIATDPKSSPANRDGAKFLYSRVESTLPENKGALYTVSINATDDELLDWDKVLGEQPEAVQQAIASHELSNLMALKAPLKLLSGAEIYYWLQNNAEIRNSREEAPAIASDDLLSLGIKGIKYLDQGSRPSLSATGKTAEQLRQDLAKLEQREAFSSMTDSEWSDHEATKAHLRSEIAKAEAAKTYNYVVFSDDDITITHENGQAVSLATQNDKLRAGSAVMPALDVFRKREHVEQRMAEDLTPEGKAQVESIAAAQRGALGDAADILAVQQARNTKTLLGTWTRAEEWLHSSLKPVLNFLTVSPNQAALDPSSPTATASAMARLRQDWLIKDQISRLEDKIATGQKQLDEAIAEDLKLDEEKAIQTFLEQNLRPFPKRYADYLKQLAKLEGPNATLAAQARAALERAHRAGTTVEEKLAPRSAMEAVLKEIAGNPAIDLVLQNPEEYLALDASGNEVWNTVKINREILRRVQEVGLKSIKEEAADLVRPTAEGLPPTLERLHNLHKVLLDLRAIMDKTGETKQQTADFNAQFPSKTKVSVRQAMQRYFRWRTEKNRVDSVLRANRNQRARLADRLAGRMEAVDLLKKLVASPTYTQSLLQATQLMGAHKDGVVIEEANRKTFLDPRDPTRNITILTGFQQALEDENIRLLVELSNAITEVYGTRENPTDAAKADPLTANTYWFQRDEIVAHMLDFRLGPEFEKDSPNFKAALGWVATNRGLSEIVGGRSLLELGNAIAAQHALMDQVNGIRSDNDIGVNPFTEKVVKAIKSRASEAEGGFKWYHIVGPAKDAFSTIIPNAQQLARYSNEIINPILASGQVYGQAPLKVGDTIPGSSYVVKPEDMEVVKAQLAYERPIRNAVETPKDSSGKPILVEETFKRGKRETRFRRKAETKGEYIVARGFAPKGMELAAKWRAAKTANAGSRVDATTTEKILNDILTNPDTPYDWVLRGYVTDTDPTYVRNSKFEKEFKALAAKARKQTMSFDTLDDVVQAIADLRKQDPEVVRSELEPELRKELAGLLDRYSSMADTTPLKEDTLKIHNFMVFGGESGESFVRARGNPVAPHTFYHYARISTPEMGSFAGGAINAARNRAIAAGERVTQALKVEIDNLQAEINSKTVAGRKYKNEREARTAQHFLLREGQRQLALEKAIRLQAQLANELNKSKQAAMQAHDDMLPTAREIIGEILNGPISALLSMPKAFIANFASGTYGAQVIMAAHTGGLGALVRQALWSSPKLIAKTLAGEATRVAQNIPGLRNVVNSPLGKAMLGPLSEWAAEATAIRNRLVEQRLLDPTGAFNRHLLHAQYTAGIGNRARTANADIQSTVPGLVHQTVVRSASIFNEFVRNPLLSSWSPRWIDYLANEMNVAFTLDQIDRLRAHAMDIGDARGGKPDPMDKRQAIKPEELGLSHREMMWLARYFRPAGPLDTLLFDYYNRVKATPIEQRKDVPFLTPEQEAAVIRSFGEHMNIIREHNSPATFRLGAEWKMVGTFKNYPAMMFDQVAKLVPYGSHPKDLPKEALKAMAVLMLLLFGGALAYELGVRANYAATGKLPAQPTFANVQEEPTDLMAAKYAATVLSSMVPYGGTIADFALGGAQNPFDFSSSVMGLAHMRDMFNTAKEIAYTGDVVRPVANYVNRYGGILASIANRLPGYSEDLESRNVGRALRAATPADIEMRSYAAGAPAANPSPLATYLRRAENAAFGGDMTKARAALNQAVEWRMNKKGLTRAQAEKEVQQQLSARQPEMRTYGRILSDTERQRVVGRMTGAQRASYDQGQRVFRSMLGPKRGKGRSRRLRGSLQNLRRLKGVAM